MTSYVTVILQVEEAESLLDMARAANAQVRLTEVEASARRALEHALADESER